MGGRFVEQEKVGWIDKQSGKGKSYFFTAAENFTFLVDGITAEAKATEQAAHLLIAGRRIAVLDDIKGSKDWRSSGESKSASLNTTILQNLIGLYCVVPRDHYSEVYDSILEAGAPGVSTNFGVMADQTGMEGEACNEEWALVYTSLAPSSVENVLAKISAKIDATGIDRFAFYTLPIPRALTYLGG